VAVDSDAPVSGLLQLKHVLAASDITDLSEVFAIRHTAKEDGLPDLWAAPPEAVLAYTRTQDSRFRVFPENPPRIWLIFMEDGSHGGAHRSRFYGAYENDGESLDERTETNRSFHITPSHVLELMKNRLVVEWTGPRRWHRRGELAGEFRVLDIADPQVIPFVGYDKVLLTYKRLQAIVDDPHYAKWHSALGAVRGIYLISDTSNRKQYVGKADGAGGIHARWSDYAHNGHAWNKELVALPTGRSEHFVFSILRVFGPEATKKQVDDAEVHFKEALLTRRKFGGYNAN
jgi:hypothetical protein